VRSPTLGPTIGLQAIPFRRFRREKKALSPRSPLSRILNGSSEHRPGFSAELHALDV